MIVSFTTDSRASRTSASLPSNSALNPGPVVLSDAPAPYREDSTKIVRTAAATTTARLLRLRKCLVVATVLQSFCGKRNFIGLSIRSEAASKATRVSITHKHKLLGERFFRQRW